MLKINTFLPDASFTQSAVVLDNSRLGKQRVETLQLLNAIVHRTGWIHHPCTKMWKNHVDALVLYGLVMCNEWISRGFEDTCFAKISIFSQSNVFNSLVPMPKWLGCNYFHATHRSNLLRKDPLHYGQFGWKEHPRMVYYWPGEG